MQAPIQVFGIEGRYAHALFSAASKQNVIEKVEKELADFQVRHCALSYICRVYAWGKGDEMKLDARKGREGGGGGGGVDV